MKENHYKDEWDFCRRVLNDIQGNLETMLQNKEEEQKPKSKSAIKNAQGLESQLKTPNQSPTPQTL
ncbi:hypothetical protein [Helicobacter felis]|uniref:hypothetical protein n=1 Tax=Helicobacter felis TaxID=214 RepID=UPI0001EFA579|nr:hypothetical protein [Helicobacter felis]